MHTDLPESRLTLSDAERLLALGTGTALLAIGASSRRSTFGSVLMLSSAPLLLRGVLGHWPVDLARQRDDTRSALGGPRGISVRESVRVERPVAEVYRYWRQLENLPTFMSHLERVTVLPDGRSHWVAKGPAGVAVEWDAEIINETENRLLGWRSLPGADVAVAGSVNFSSVRGGRSTQLTVLLQYAPPLGRAGALIASLFGRNPSQTIREDLRHLKHVLEAGEVPRASAGGEKAPAGEPRATVSA
jgi:uncharacterized membrane protein